ncbi:hypothetical protein [Methanosphaera sp.]
MITINKSSYTIITVHKNVIK